MSTSQSHPAASPGHGSGGVIHDIGYRPYTGQRLGERSIFAALYLTSLRNAFGLGRSGRSKVLPFILLGLNLIPMIVIVSIMVATKIGQLPFDYAFYVTFAQVLVSVFAASQAPVLFSRDLRYGSIVLYLTRPMSSTVYSMARWLGLCTAVFVFMTLPLVLMYIGALLAELPFWQNTREVAQAIGFGLLLAMMLASICGLISTLTVRRGFAVVGSIGVLIFGSLVASVIQDVASYAGNDGIAQLFGLFSPFTLYSGMVDGLTATDGGGVVTPSGAMSALYVVVSLVVAVGGLALLDLRYRKVASR